MKKLAVLFPGIGYTVDKPLMYFSRRIAAANGYDIKPLPYSGFPKKVIGDRGKMEESFLIALQQAQDMLRDVDFEAYADILFIGKSVGTIVAAKIASDSRAADRIRFVLYTPVEETFSYPIRDAVVFTGADDPWVGKEKSRISGLCEQRGIPCTLVPSANHSLESSDVFADLEELFGIMQETERFIKLR